MLQRRKESITAIPDVGKVFDYIDENGVPVIKAGRVERRPINKPNPHENITRFTLASDNTVVGKLLSGEIIPSDVPAGDLTEVVLGNTVTSIRDESFGDGVFQNMGLESVTIPDSVTHIGSYAFYNNSLTSVTIPDSVTSIGSYAFYNNSLTNVTIGNSVTSINFAAFRNNSLTSVTIPDSVTSVGDYAFSFNSLTSITIPDSVTSIGLEAFWNNLNLETVYTETPVSAFGGSDIFLDTALTTVYVRDNDGQLATYPDTSGGPVSWQGASNVSFVEWENWPDPVPNN